jgi:riboflavin synthase
MFTGIIEELGSVETIEQREAGARARVRCAKVLAGTLEGSSIAVNGVCLTVTELRPSSFSADIAPETLRRTNLGRLHAGSPVNLERPLAASARLDGHIVQGHIDCAGELLSLDLLGDNNWWLKLGVPAELERYLVFKGAVALDGISLTVAAIEDAVLSVAIIPHTFENTTLKSLRAGALVNIETDILAKYVEKMLRLMQPVGGLTFEKLRNLGF